MDKSNDESDEEDIEEKKFPRGQSIAHHIINNTSAYFVSFDIKTGRENVRSIQMLLAEVCWILVVKSSLEKKGCSTKVSLLCMERELDVVFNQYVNPSRVPDSCWKKLAIDVHNILPTNERIKNADDIGVVWAAKFHKWIIKYIPEQQIMGHIGCMEWGGL